MSKRKSKSKHQILSNFATQQSLLSTNQHSAPVLLQGRDGLGISPRNSPKSWSKELMAAASTLQSIAMSNTRVRSFRNCFSFKKQNLKRIIYIYI